MKFRLFSILALTGFLLISCAVDELPAEGGSIIAEMETYQTRTTVTDEGTFTWSAGDKVWLQTTTGSVIGTLSSGAGSSSAEFTYGGFVGEMTGKAVYPYNDGHSVSGEVLNFVLPASYNLGSSLTNTNAAMYGVNLGGTIRFHHLAGVMRFKFKDVPAGVNKFTITLDKKINGTFVADLTTDYPIIEATATSTASEKTITLNFNTLTAKSDINIYVPLPTGTYNSLELGLYADNQSVWTYSKSVTNTVSRKSLKLMPVVTIGGSIGGEIDGDYTEQGVIDLSRNGLANCYIVSAPGAYKFTPSKGNKLETVGTIDYAVTLWETFGTDITPDVGDLVRHVTFKNGVISFETSSSFKKGNALIAAKDPDGKILWSWHIWLTDQPEGQVYFNDAGTMMDRNLGATSATPGDAGTIGLVYQWGRKDPFMGASSFSLSSLAKAKSTTSWFSASSNVNNGSIDYATANPTTFIKENSSNYDWLYTGDKTTDNTRWTESDKQKSIYDPCPAGWRVPDGGENGVWATSLGSVDDFTLSSTKNGKNFSGKFGTDENLWYPASGSCGGSSGSIDGAGESAFYWSATPEGWSICCLYFSIYSSGGIVYPSYARSRAKCIPVRCVQVTD